MLLDLGVVEFKVEMTTGVAVGATGAGEGAGVVATVAGEGAVVVTVAGEGAAVVTVAGEGAAVVTVAGEGAVVVVTGDAPLDEPPGVGEGVTAMAPVGEPALTAVKRK